MSKRLTILVNKCAECPYALAPAYDPHAPYYCTETEIDIYDLGSLPNWCPLSDWGDMGSITSYRKFKVSNG